MDSIWKIGKMMPRVLLVDDNRNFRTSLAIGLKREGFEVEAFGNPIEAYNRIQEASFDVLLTDLRMPYLNGYELARLVKREQPMITIILLSAYDFKDYLPQDTRVHEFVKLSKPFEMRELLTLLAEQSTGSDRSNPSSLRQRFVKR